MINGVIEMDTIYGSFTSGQIAAFKKSLRSSIFFVLLCVDPVTACEHTEIDVNKLLDNLLRKLNSYNELLMHQEEVVEIMTLLQSAKDEYNSEHFDFAVCRKLILDAGSEVLKIREVGDSDA